MQASIPKDWIPCSKEEFEELLRVLDYTRDGYAGGIYYLFRHSGKRFGLVMDDGRYFYAPSNK